MSQANMADAVTMDTRSGYVIRQDFEQFRLVSYTSKNRFLISRKTKLVSRIIFLKQDFFSRGNSEKYFLTEKIFLKIFLEIRKNISFQENNETFF